MTALLTLTMVLLAPVPEPAPLKWKLAKGDVFYVKTVHHTKQTETTNGKDEDGDIQQTAYFKYKVLSVGEKGYTLEQTIQKTELKSNLPVADELTEKFAGTMLIFTLDVNFAVTKVEGLDKLIDKLAGDNEALRKTFKGSMTEEAYGASIRELFRTGTTKNVKLNDKWKGSHSHQRGNGNGTFEVDTAYKLAASTANGEKVTWTATTKFTLPKVDPNTTSTISAWEVKTDEYTGEFVFDTKLHRLITSSSRMKIIASMTISWRDVDTEFKSVETVESKITVSDKSLLKD